MIDVDIRLKKWIIVPAKTHILISDKKNNEITFFFEDEKELIKFVKELKEEYEEKLKKLEEVV